MKKMYKHLRAYLLLPVLLAFGLSANAQSPACSTYIFSAGSETFTYLSSGTSVTGIICDDCVQANIPLGFSFPFCGNYYTTVSVHSNGYVSLSNSTSVYLSPSLSYIPNIQPVLFNMWGDEYGNYGSAKYLTSGTAPNRVWTMEWRDWRPFSYSTYSEYSMQMRLYESTGRIQYIYKREPTGAYPLPCVGVGIAYSSTDYQSLPNFGTSPVPSSTTFNTCISSYPATGQVYTWDMPTPCAKSTALTLGAYNSQSASFSWTGVSGAASYDYAVDQTANYTPNVATTIYNTTATSGTVNGLSASTTYYLHVRTRCSPTSISLWDTMSFTTLPPCSKPSGVVFSNIDSNSAAFQWANAANVLQFNYIVDRNRATPTSTDPNLKTTTTTFVQLPDTCQDGTLYYVHIRAKCVANDSSAWSLDSFRTPVPCRKPALSMTYLSAGNSVTTWPAVPTAYTYEYYLGALPVPSNGTPILNNYVQTPFLVPATNYTMSVRCLCEFYGVKTVSDWSSLDFVTPHPNAVSNTNNKHVSLDAYPNPVSNTLTIRAIGILAENGRAEIMDVTGKLLKSVKITSEYTNVDVASLASGVYVIKYTDDEQSTIIKFTKE